VASKLIAENDHLALACSHSCHKFYLFSWKGYSIKQVQRSSEAGDDGRMPGRGRVARRWCSA